MVRARAPVLARARAGGGAGRAGRGGAARLRRDPQRQAHHRHRAVRRLRPGRGSGVRRGGDHGARVERVPLAGPLDGLADGRLGGRGGGGRAPRADHEGPRARATPARRGLRAGGIGVRGLDGPLPVDARRAAGPRLLPRRVRQLVAVQPRARDRQRGLLAPHRARLHPRPRPLPAPLRGELAGPRGRDRSDGGGAHPRAWRPRRPSPPAARRRPRPSAICGARRTATAALAPRRTGNRARSTAAGRRSASPGRGPTRAT